MSTCPSPGADGQGPMRVGVRAIKADPGVPAFVTSREDTKSKQLRPSSEAVDSACAELRSSMRDSGRAGLSTRVNKAILDRHCKEVRRPTCAESTRGRKKTEPIQDRPTAGTKTSRQANCCSRSNGPVLERSSIGGIVSGLARLLIGTNKAVFAKSITIRKESDRELSQTLKPLPAHASVFNERASSRCKGSGTDEDGPSQLDTCNGTSKSACDISTTNSKDTGPNRVLPRAAAASPDRAEDCKGVEGSGLPQLDTDELAPSLPGLRGGKRLSK